MIRSIPLFLLITAAVAASSADLTVTVVDAGNEAPIAGAELVLERRDGSERRPLTTDDNGQVTVVDIAAVGYLLEVTARGFEPDYREFELTDGEPLVLTIALISNAFVIDELVVTSTGIDDDMDLQTGYVNLDAATLDAIPGIVESDPIRALQSLPGVSAASDISSGLYIRGGSPDQNLMRLDGVTV